MTAHEGGPDSSPSTLSELIKLTSAVARVDVKVDDLKRDYTNATLRTEQRLTSMEGRLDIVESAARRSEDGARSAVKSAHELTERVSETEGALKKTVESLTTGVNARVHAVEEQVANLSRETKEQTTLLERVVQWQREQDAIRHARLQLEAETKALKAERDAARDTHYKRVFTAVGISIPVVVAVITALTTYTATKQANHDSPPVLAPIDAGK